MASRAATGRAVAVIVGLALAAIAALLLWRYVDAADRRARGDAEEVVVFRATTGIPEGTSINTANDAGMFESSSVARSDLPADPVTELVAVAGQVAVGPIQEGAVLQVAMFGPPNLAEADFEVEDGRVGISLQMAAPEGASGYLGPDDRVGVIAHIAAPPVSTSTELDDQGNPIEITEQPEVPETRAQFVATDAKVLAIGRREVVTDELGNQDEQVDTTQELVLVTLSVTPDEAEKLVFANYEGLLYLTIQPALGELPDTQGRDFDNLFSP